MHGRFSLSARLATLGAAALLATAACQKEKAPEAGPPPATQDDAAETAEAPAAEPQPEAESTLQSEEVTYTAGDVTMKGYLVWDAAIEGPRPGVLVVHEWWGHNDYARRRARMLAQLGYTALAVDMYGDGKQADHPGDAGKFAGAVMGDLPGAEARFDAAHQLLDQHPTTDPKRTAAIGYCFGGGVVLHMARVGKDLQAVASFHGSLGPTAPVQGTIQTPILVLHGEADPMVPPAVVEAFKEEMAAAGAELTFIGYPGATHAFTNPEATELGEKFGLPLAYDAEADAASWDALVNFLKEKPGAG